MRSQRRSNPTTPDPTCGSRGSARPRSRDHYQILLDAEVARLVHALRPFGVLREQTLAQRAGCATWRAGAFRAALQEGARHGKLELLPFDFVGLPRSQTAEHTARRMGIAVGATRRPGEASGSDHHLLKRDIRGLT